MHWRSHPHMESTIVAVGVRGTYLGHDLATAVRTSGAGPVGSRTHRRGESPRTGSRGRVMNASDDGYEPVGESPELSGMGRMLAAADGIRDKAERQAQALDEIRNHLATVDGKEFGAFPGTAFRVAGEKACAAAIAAILERHGLA